MTLSSRARAALQREWLAAIEAEIARRAAAREVDAGGDRKRFHDELDRIAERMRAAPNFVEPPPAEKALYLQRLDDWFRARASKQRT